MSFADVVGVVAVVVVVIVVVVVVVVAVVAVVVVGVVVDALLSVVLDNAFASLHHRRWPRRKL